MRQRKRSAAITLVLAGAVSGCGEPVPQRDVYLSQAECQRDWAQAQQCEPARDGRYSNTWFYGPPYYGRTWPSGRPRPSDNAIDSYEAPNARVSSSTSSTSGLRSWSSSSSSSSGVSRGGFGSSSHSSSG
jgi:uncharacterized protein YgiB involved in biofilm formation